MSDSASKEEHSLTAEDEAVGNGEEKEQNETDKRKENDDFKKQREREKLIPQTWIEKLKEYLG